MVFAPRDTDGGSLTCQKPHEGAKGALTYFSRETGVLMQSACESLADADISPGNPNVTGSYRTVNNTLGSNNYTESVWLDVSGHDPGDGGDCPSYVNFKPKSEDDKRPTDEAAALIKDCKEMLMIVLDECECKSPRGGHSRGPVLTWCALHS